MVYAENEIELLWPIRSSVVYDETKQDSDMIDHTGMVYAKKDTKQSWLIGSGANCDEN